MKAPIFKAALLIAVTLHFFSCQKDISDLSLQGPLDSKASVDKTKPIERPLKGSIYSHTTLVLDEGGNIELGVPGWYPGYGEGNLTHFGKFYTLYNQYATGFPVPNNPFGVYGNRAPVITDAFQQPDLEASLRANGFTDADITSMVQKEVSYVIYDKQGNSIWSRAKAIGMEHLQTMTFIVDVNYTKAVRTLVYSEVEIVGGTGKFVDAKGAYTITGTSDRVSIPATSNDDLQIDGYIIY